MKTGQSPVYTMKHPHCKGVVLPYETPRITAEKGCASHSCAKSESDIRQDECRKVCDKHRILYGESARRFYEYVDAPPTEKDREMSRRVYEIIEKEEREKDRKVRDKVLKQVDDIIKHEWTKSFTVEQPYCAERHTVISSIRNAVSELRKKQGEQE
jgi:hypothetical protein